MALSFWQKLVGCKECSDSAELVALENSYEKLQKDFETLDANSKETARENSSLKGMITDLNLQLANVKDKEVPSAAEIKWNTKYPQDNALTYTCRYVHLIDGTNEACQVDPRIFFQPTAGALRGISGSILASFRVKNKRDPTNDEYALEAVRWVRKNIAYKNDIKVQGIDEYWQFWYETLELKSGDCEDGAILMANIMLACGIPYWRIRLNAGDVLGGGHAYVTYCRETDDEFVILDWCYWPNDKLPKDRVLHRDEQNYSGNSFGIWWSWNTKYIFRKVTFVEGIEWKSTPKKV